MTGIILVGHGNFGTGMLSSLELLSCTPEYCKAIDFLSGMTQEDLEEQVLALVHAEGWTKTVLLTDIVGGTPFKAAVKLSLEDPEIRVIAGINLPVLLQLAVDADQAVDIDGCIEQAVEEGRFCLKKWILASSVLVNKCDTSPD